MTREETKAGANRRDFLRAAGLAPVAAGAAIVAPTVAEAAPAAVETAGDYRETQHVRTVYELARF